MTEESTLPSITSTGVTSKNCPCCRVCVADGVSCTLSQILEVPGRDNTAESELVTKGTMLAGTGVKEFCWKLAAETPTVKVCIVFCERWDLISLRTKLIAPCELLRQLMYQSHLKLPETPHNPTLCDAKPYSLVWVTQKLLKLGHSEILPYRNCTESWKIGRQKIYSLICQDQFV